MDTPPEGLPIAEIVRRYPNQWVLVEETAWDPHGLPTICQPRFVNFLPHLHDWLTTNAAGIIAGASSGRVPTGCG
jgi:hypothetical protein